MIHLAYLTTKQLQEKLQVTAVTIWRWRKEGMPAKKFGRSVRFEENAVIAWLEKKDR